MYGINSEPPKNCLDCPLCQGEYGPGNEKSYCAIKSEVKLKYKGSRPKECPIITELDEGVIQKVLNKRCMTVITNEYLIELLGNRPQGEWVDHSEEGYVECPICEHLTTCEDNIDELRYCWNCGAHLQKGGTE